MKKPAPKTHADIERKEDAVIRTLPPAPKAKLKAVQAQERKLMKGKR